MLAVVDGTSSHQRMALWFQWDSHVAKSLAAPLQLELGLAVEKRPSPRSQRYPNKRELTPASAWRTGGKSESLFMDGNLVGRGNSKLCSLVSLYIHKMAIQNSVFWWTLELPAPLFLNTPPKSPKASSVCPDGSPIAC